MPIIDSGSSLFQTTYPASFSVISCQSAGDGFFSPKGTHLRWFLSKTSGFPDNKGFDIYKLLYDDWSSLKNNIKITVDFTIKSPSLEEKKPIGKSNWSKNNVIQQFSNHFLIIQNNRTQLFKTEKGLALKNRGNRESVLLHFYHPVLYLEIEFEDIPNDIIKPKVRVFYKSMEIEQIPVQERLILERPQITDILIPADFGWIKNVSYITTQSVSYFFENNVPKPHKIYIPSSANEAYGLVKNEVNSGLSNRFITTKKNKEFKKKYAVPLVTELVTQINSTIGNPGKVIIAPAQVKSGSSEIQVLKYIQLAALDPNVARLCGLYWVDNDTKPSLYMVKGNYLSGNIYGFTFSNQPSEKAILPGEIQAQQKPGIRYQSKTPFGQVGINWNHISNQYLQTNKPVFFDVIRGTDGKNEFLTETKPQLLNTKSKIFFRDPLVSVRQQVQYSITAIDIFGRKGETTKSNELFIRDLENPVPPQRIKGKIHQDGYPWKIPSQRRDPDIKKGTVQASFEFNESQHNMSPDANELVLVYKIGDSTEISKKPETWNELSKAGIRPPLRSDFIWNEKQHALKFNVYIAAIIETSTEDILENLNRLGADAEEIIHELSNSGLNEKELSLLELLLDNTILEPDLFKGYVFGWQGNSYTVLNSHAGIAYGQDTEKNNFALTSRLIVKKTDNSLWELTNELITLAHPLSETSLSSVQTWYGQQNVSEIEKLAPLIQITLLNPPGKHEEKSTGGELCIDYYYKQLQSNANNAVAIISPITSPDSQQTLETLKGRVVYSDYSQDGISQYWVRLRPQDFLKVMLITQSSKTFTTHARYYAPYISKAFELGLNGQGGDIKIDLQLDQRFETLWISAYSLDTGGLTSSEVANPFELKIANPPIVQVPATPYPNLPSGASSIKGFASPPNFEKKSSVSIKWDAILAQGNPIANIRYELARALDKTIIESDKKNWLRGANSDHHTEAGVLSGIIATGQLQAFELTDNQLPVQNFQLNVKAPDKALIETLKSIKKGRIQIMPGSAPEKYYKLLRVSETTEGIQLSVKPHGEISKEKIATIVKGTNFTVEAYPDYSKVIADDDKLRLLANTTITRGPMSGEGLNDDAFGVVTGIPILATEFVDIIPGIGSNRYFYKVRSVFTNSLKTQWSDCSVGFYQLDLSPPVEPVLINKKQANEKLFIFIESLPDSAKGVQLLTADIGETEATSLWKEYFREPIGDQLLLRNASIYAFNNLVDLSTFSNKRQLSLNADPNVSPKLSAVNLISGLASINLVNEAKDSDKLFLELKNNTLLIKTIDDTADFNGIALGVTVECDNRKNIFYQRSGQMELVLDIDDLAGKQLFLRTFKEVELADKTIILTSDLVVIHESKQEVVL